MTFKELSSKFNFTLPDYAESYFDDFIAEYDRNVPVLSEKDAILVADTTELPEDGKSELIRCAKVLNDSDDGHLCGSFLACLTVYKRLPWVNYIYQTDLFTVDGLMPEQVGWVLVATMLANTLNNKKPPADLNVENLTAFRNYSKSCFGSKGYWGITEWHWNMLCAGGCMFLFGILKFVPNHFTNRFFVITDGKEYVSLTNNGYFIGKENELIATEEGSVAKTYFYEDDTKFVANVVSRNGLIDVNTTEFDKSKWRMYLKAGSPTLAVHIPSNIAYTPENARAAYQEAVKFYKDFYPEHKTLAIDCSSWILSPQLRKVLPETSNILAIMDSGHLLPDFGSFTEDIMFIRKGTSMYNKIAEERSKGTVFHIGIMYVPVDEIDTFGLK